MDERPKSFSNWLCACGACYEPTVDIFVYNLVSFIFLISISLLSNGTATHMLKWSNISSLTFLIILFFQLHGYIYLYNGFNLFFFMPVFILEAYQKTVVDSIWLVQQHTVNTNVSFKRWFTGRRRCRRQETGETGGIWVCLLTLIVFATTHSFLSPPLTRQEMSKW